MNLSYKKWHKTLINVVLIVMLAQDSIIYWVKNPLVGYLDEIIILFITIFSFFYAVKIGKIYKISLIFIILLVCFSILGIISSIVNSNLSFITLIGGNFLAIKFWLIVISFMNLDINKNTEKTLIDAILFAEKIVIIIAIFNFFFPNMYYQLFPNSYISKRFGLLSICSLFDHPGKYGWFMLLSGIVHYIKFKREEKPKEFRYAFISMLLAIFSFRTKVIVGIIGCIAYYLLFLDKKNVGKLLRNILITLTLISMLLFIFSNLIENTYTLYFTNEKGVSARRSLSQNGTRIATEYFPLGVGFGKYATWYSSKDYSEYYYKYKMNRIYGLSPEFSSYITDVYWPAIMGETGVFGLLIYLYMLVVTVRLLHTILKYDKNNTFLYISILLLIQTIIESFGEPSFNSSPQNILVGTVLGIAISCGMRELDKNNVGNISMHRLLGRDKGKNLKNENYRKTGGG